MGLDRIVRQRATFSILERIDVGETIFVPSSIAMMAILSVSSNGSTWVKLARVRRCSFRRRTFQYPRTDRRG